jgi:hypothetical protein
MADNFSLEGTRGWGAGVERGGEVARLLLEGEATRQGSRRASRRR